MRIEQWRFELGTLGQQILVGSRSLWRPTQKIWHNHTHKNKHTHEHKHRNTNHETFPLWNSKVEGASPEVGRTPQLEFIRIKKTLWVKNSIHKHRGELDNSQFHSLGIGSRSICCLSNSFTNKSIFVQFLSLRTDIYVSAHSFCRENGRWRCEPIR